MIPRIFCLTALLLCATAAMGGFVAYNDCHPGGSTIYPKTTQYGVTGATGSPGSTGQLVDYATGSPVAATVQVYNSGAMVDGTGPDVNFSAGTDAANLFSGKVDFKGNISYYGASGWYVDLIFTNLDPGKQYTLAATYDRGRTTPAPATGYTNRWTKITISDADASTYACSGGAWKINDSSVSICAVNDLAGYVAQWTNIAPGADGDFSVRFTYAGNTPGVEIPLGEAQDGVKAYAPAGFMLVEVPEPCTLSLLALAGVALVKKRRN